MSQPAARAFLSRGVTYALASAVLFGLSTPAAKRLVGDLPPLMLAALLYLGSGVGLATARVFGLVGRAEAPLGRTDVPWLAGAILCGGVLGPVLLLWGLRATTAATASLLLNLEGVFTALLAWFVFHENFDRRIALGMALIVAGGVVLTRQSGSLGLPTGALAVACACLCWAIDNNLTQKVSGGDAVQIAALKGLVAGSVNLAAAFATGASRPPAGAAASAAAVGFLGYGVSLACFVLALRHLGTARTGAYFSVAPFIGAAAAIGVFGEPLRPSLVVAAAIMGAGVWLHLTERHEHQHHHQRMVHSHSHFHDEHHQHDHPPGTPWGEPHTHEHAHQPLSHSHPHYPDLHHRHRHR